MKQSFDIAIQALPEATGFAKALDGVSFTVTLDTADPAKAVKDIRFFLGDKVTDQVRLTADTGRMPGERDAVLDGPAALDDYLTELWLNHSERQASRRLDF